MPHVINNARNDRVADALVSRHCKKQSDEVIHNVTKDNFTNGIAKGETSNNGLPQPSMRLRNHESQVFLRIPLASLRGEAEAIYNPKSRLKDSIV